MYDKQELDTNLNAALSGDIRALKKLLYAMDYRDALIQNCTNVSEKLRALLAENPDQHIALTLLGYVLKHTHSAEATSLFEKAIALGNVDAMIFRAIRHYEDYHQTLLMLLCKILMVLPFSLNTSSRSSQKQINKLTNSVFFVQKEHDDLSQLRCNRI